MNSTQVIFDEASGVWILEDTDGLTWRELARGVAANEVEARAAAEASQGIVTELEAAQMFGSRLVLDFEAKMLGSGINGRRGEALVLYNALAPVRTPLKDGLLHVAYDALALLLGTPIEGRGSPYAVDEVLVPLYDALAHHINETPWGK